MYLQCLHNTPVISMGTSPGMAGGRRRTAPVCDTPFLNKWLCLSLTFQRVREVKPRSHGGRKKRRPSTETNDGSAAELAEKFGFWSSLPVQSPGEEEEDKQRGGGETPKEVPRWSCYLCQVNQQAVDLYKSIMSWTVIDWHELNQVSEHRAVKLLGQWREITQ